MTSDDGGAITLRVCVYCICNVQYNAMQRENDEKNARDKSNFKTFRHTTLNIYEETLKTNHRINSRIRFVIFNLI